MQEDNQKKSWLMEHWHDAKGNFKYDLFSRFGWPEIRAAAIAVGGWLVQHFSTMNVGEIAGWIIVAGGIAWGDRFPIQKTHDNRQGGQAWAFSSTDRRRRTNLHNLRPRN